MKALYMDMTVDTEKLKPKKFSKISKKDKK